ncbi:MATH and LRR domain-containing protein PFE0570w-like [Leptopilina heterotoma]|uniref:MATH and LRR domain-containing protein PFE0570w-like n=1 Tax=Leptopilina heterotoma TaxID=63436 RepID=UPI001CA9AD8E|nr:MATH and LRR domain-containing protein PFE0570w-like [Leptopilina heterotoma]
MTSVLPDQHQRNVVRIMKQKSQNQKTSNHSGREETRSFLKFSRENLSLSNSDLEQGFNKTKFRIDKHTIISVTALILALSCVAVEICRLKWIVDNSREMEILKRDVDTLKHRLLEEDLLDELKAFEEKLYSEGSDDDDLDMENIDYDYNYDDESHDYTDYQALGLATQATNLSQGAKASNISDHDLDEILVALRRMEVKRSRDLERCLREKIKSVERDKVSKERKEEKQIENEESENEKVDNDKKKGLKENAEVEEEEEPENIQTFTKVTKLNITDMKISAEMKQKRSILGAEDIDNYQSDPIYEIPKELSINNNNNNRTRKQRNRNIESSTNRNETKVKNDSIGQTMTTRQKSLSKKFFTKSRSEEIEEETKEHNENSRDDVDSLTLKKEEGLGIKKNRKKLLWDRVKHDNAKIKKLKENLKEAIASRSHGRGISKRHLKVPRQVFAVHYGGDSSLFSDEDEHTGNGRAKHSEGVFKAWQASDWVTELGMNRHFFLGENGKLFVQEPGLYLVYAQIHYLDEHDENGFHMLVNGRPVLQCMVYSPGTGHKSRSCFSAQITVLQSGDHIVLKDVASARYTLFQEDKSFFGLVKLGDWRQQQKHQQHTVSP